MHIHIWEIMLSLSVGILGGIVSGVIVSRVFNIITMINDQLREFEENYNRLWNIRGMLIGIKQVMEFTYDSEIKKEEEIKQKGYKSESEYYLAHKEARWIDADALIQNLLNECKKWGSEYDKKITEMFGVESDIQQIYKEMHQVIFKILNIKEATFDCLQQVDAEILRIKARYDDYKKRRRKVYLRKIFCDRLLIAITIVVIILFIVTVVLFANNI